MPALPRRAAVIGAIALALACPACAQTHASPAGAPQLNLPRTQLTVGMHRIDAQIAATDAQRATGLMARASMPEGEGMLFVFERAGVQCFWMKNTLIPLTAAFIDDDGRITNLADMQPGSVDNHCSTQPVRYVLEMNQGWFAQRHIRAGHTVRGLPAAQ